MATVYLSSTYVDLVRFRRVVVEALTTLGHRVLAMEHAVAADERPLDVCLQDVSSCDIYVGVFAWRYGHVPPESNPTGASITELEYRHARALGKPTLIFLLDEKVPWLREWMDPPRAEGSHSIDALRRELQTSHSVSFFKSDEELGRLASSAVTRWQHSNAARHTAAPASDPEAVADVAVPPSYLDWVKRECDSIELLGLRLKHGQSVRIGSVYVPVQAAGGLNDAGLRGTTRLLDFVNERSIYVTGAAGSGKSTFCRWVAWLLATGAMPVRSAGAADGELFPENLRGKVPLLIQIRDFYQMPLPGLGVTAHMFESAIETWLAQRKPGGLEWPAAAHQIRSGNTVLMFDGIDEAPLPARDAIVKGLRECVPVWTAAGNRVLATSRPYAASEATIRQLNLPHVVVGGMSRDMQQLLVHRWFDILSDDADRAKSIAGGLLADLQDRAWLRPLAENPLLLTSMCIVYGQGRRLPEDRYDLYDRIVDTVLNNRFDASLVALVRNRLAVVAYGMHVGVDSERRDIPVAQTTISEIDRVLQDYQETRKWYTEDAFKRAADARDRLLSDSGLLQPIGDRSASFFHLSFQEFLAAQRLADLDRREVLNAFREHGSKPEWKSTLSFLFGAQLANNVTPASAVEVLLRIIEQFVESANPVRALLAADAVEILRGRQITLDNEALRRMRELCAAEMRGQRPAIERCQLGDALGRIGDHRFRQERWWLPDDPALGFVEVPTGVVRLRRAGRFEPCAVAPFWIGRYPVTVAQFRAFVEDRQGNRGFVPRDPMSLRGIANHPVVRVSPDEAMAYCAWLTAKLRSALLPSALRDADGRRVRLPMAVEWSRAAAAAERCSFPWGSARDLRRFNGEGAGLGGTSAVGCFPGGATPLGVEELSGNVWEWAHELVTAGDRLPSGRRARPIDRWVGRGGSFDNGDGSVNSALVPAPDAPPNLRTFGFRVVLSQR